MSYRLPKVPPVVHHKPVPYAGPKRTIIRKRRPRTAYGMRERIESIQNIGQGRNLIIVASGPSVRDINFEGLDNTYDALYVNRPYSPLGHIAKYWAVNDQPIVNQHLRHMQKFPGQMICGASSFVRGRDIIKIKVLAGAGFSLDLIRGFHLGRSTTLSSLQAAFWMDYDHIYIVGLDMTTAEYHDKSDNPNVSPTARIERFKNEATYWRRATEILIEQNLIHKVTMVTNCNPFPFVQEYEIENNLKEPAWRSH